MAAVPFLVAAPLLHGWAFLVVLAAGGFFLQSTLPVNVTFGHQLAPVSAATVSSLMMGFAWGTGGLAVPLVGMLADRVDIAPALMIMGLAPLAAAALRCCRSPGGRRWLAAAPIARTDSHYCRPRARRVAGIDRADRAASDPPRA